MLPRRLELKHVQVELDDWLWVFLDLLLLSWLWLQLLIALDDFHFSSVLFFFLPLLLLDQDVETILRSILLLLVQAA